MNQSTNNLWLISIIWPQTSQLIDSKPTLSQTGLDWEKRRREMWKAGRQTAAAPSCAKLLLLNWICIVLIALAHMLLLLLLLLLRTTNLLAKPLQSKLSRRVEGWKSTWKNKKTARSKSLAIFFPLRKWNKNTIGLVQISHSQQPTQMERLQNRWIRRTNNNNKIATERKLTSVFFVCPSQLRRSLHHPPQQEGKDDCRHQNYYNQS